MFDLGKHMAKFFLARSHRGCTALTFTTTFWDCLPSSKYVYTFFLMLSHWGSHEVEWNKTLILRIQWTIFGMALTKLKYTCACQDHHARYSKNILEDENYNKPLYGSINYKVFSIFQWLKLWMKNRSLANL